MENTRKKIWKKLKESTRGAALLMVLLVTVFVILAGSSVMFTSYNGYLMKLMEREGSKTFYTTEEIMDLVRVQYQEAASDALQKSYTQVMSEYSFIVSQYKEEAAIQEAAQNKFNEYFIKELHSGRDLASGGTADLFTVDDLSNLATNLEAGGARPVEGTYDTSALGALLPADAKYTYEFGTSTDASNNTLGQTIAGTTLFGEGPSASTTETPDNKYDGTFAFGYGDNGYPRLVIENLTVSYVADTGYQTNITSDIIIEMPMFTHTGEINSGNTGRNEGLPFDNAATVGKYWVKTSEKRTNLDELLVKGDIYGGTFFTYNETGTVGTMADSQKIVFSHGDGRLITNADAIVDTDRANLFITGTNADRFRTDNLGREIHEGLEVYDGTTFTTLDTSEIWARSVYVDAGSNMKLISSRTPYDSEYLYYFDEDRFKYYNGIFYHLTASGNIGLPVDHQPGVGGTYIAGDILVDGGEAGYQNIGGSNVLVYNDSKVTLGGDMVLFGNGRTAETSSAIIIDGPDVVLDFTALKDIRLAGSAYLSPGRVDSVSGEYDLGQSMSALPDQIAYLIPPEALSNSGYGNINSNPIMVETETSLFTGTTVSTSHLLWGSKNIGNYAESTPTIISRTYGDTILYYFFYDFKDSTAQAEYLKDYVANNDSFQTNLELFVDMDKVVDGDLSYGLTNSGSYYYVKDGQLVVEDPSNTDLDSVYALYQERFENVSVTLWPDVKAVNTEIIRMKPGTVQLTDTALLDADMELMKGYIDGSIKKADGSTYTDSETIETAYWVRHGMSINMGTTDAEKAAFKNKYYTNSTDGAHNFEYDYANFNGTDCLVDNPYDYYINYDKVQNDLAKNPMGSRWMMEFEIDGEVVAIIAQDFNIEAGTAAAYPELCMVITMSGINVDESFEGLLMSRVGIAVMEPIISNAEDVNYAMDAICPATGLKLRQYFQNLNFGEGGGNEETPGTSTNNAEVNWAPNDLVYYENWEKH